MLLREAPLHHVAVFVAQLAPCVERAGAQAHVVDGRRRARKAAEPVEQVEGRQISGRDDVDAGVRGGVGEPNANLLCVGRNIEDVERSRRGRGQRAVAADQVLAVSLPARDAHRDALAALVQPELVVAGFKVSQLKESAGDPKPVEGVVAVAQERELGAAWRRVAPLVGDTQRLARGAVHRGR